MATTAKSPAGSRKTAPATGAGRPAQSGQSSARRAHVVTLAAELFAQKGFRATTVREIADAAEILSGSLYHHFDSKESIGDEILSGFISAVCADYRAALTGLLRIRCPVVQSGMGYVSGAGQTARELPPCLHRAGLVW